MVPTGSNDQQRASQCGESVGMKMALVHIKGDWAEHCGTLGFPNWTPGLRPYLFCTGSTDSWFTTGGLDSQKCPFHLNSHEDYETACATCEIVVLVDSPAHARILPLLAYDNRASGCHARCLLKDISELNLKTDDRLERRQRLATELKRHLEVDVTRLGPQLFPNAVCTEVLHLGSVELFVVGGTRDTTADRGIMLRLVTAAPVEQRRLFNCRGGFGNWRCRPLLSDEPHTRPRTRETQSQRIEKP